LRAVVEAIFYIAHRLPVRQLPKDFLLSMFRAISTLGRAAPDGGVNHLCDGAAEKSGVTRLRALGHDSSRSKH